MFLFSSDILLQAISQVRLSPLEEYPGLEFQFTAGEGCSGYVP